MKFLSVILFLIVFCTGLAAQQDSTSIKKLKFQGDFRFRIEHDWNSINANGDKREDRSRLRYRFRYGILYTKDNYSSFGARLRTGNLRDQQGPHVTLGGNSGEFQLVQIGLEKLYYKFNQANYSFWIGKNSIPLIKLNELFWNDNVFPEGVAFQFKSNFRRDQVLQLLAFNAGHFIINANGKSFFEDGYLQIAQFGFTLLDSRIEIFPGFYRFKNIGNFPDRLYTYKLDYSILHIGSHFSIDKNQKLKLGLEYYTNFQNYNDHEMIEPSLKDQNEAFVVSATYGKLKEKGDWLFYLSYARMEKFSIVDYFAQNDWVRWDYSSIGASGSRISNFQGVEIKVAYQVKEAFDINLRGYIVEQIIPTGNFKENGNRIRVDLNIGF